MSDLFTDNPTDLITIKTALTINNVTNTADVDKPVSTAQQTAIDAKVTGPASAVDETPTVFDGTTGKLVKNISFATFKTALALVKADVGLSSVVNSDTTTQTNVNFVGLTAASAAADADTFPTNQGAGNLKQTFGAIKTWVKAWIVKADVGLSNVDNTADTAKPVSTAQQTALNLKADLASPALTGTPTAPTASAATNTTQIATTAMVQAAVANYIAAQDIEIFKGAINCSANPNYPAADAGHVYRVSVAGKIGGASGINVEINDRLECVVDSTASGNQATVGANWIISQVNIDGAVVGPTSAVDATPTVFDGTTGKLIKNITFATFKTSLALVKADVGLSSVVNSDTTTQANVNFVGLMAAAAAADADTFPVNQGAGNLKQTFTAVKTWIKAWIVKADVGLGNVDNTSNATERAAAATLTNKSLSDSTTSIIDDSDATKIGKFQLSGVTTATTRTLTWPDASGTIATLENAQTMSGRLTYTNNSLIMNGAANIILEIGRVDGTSSTVNFDLHSGATVTDYDTRIQATGGTGATGGGTLDFKAAALTWNTNQLVDLVTAQTLTNKSLSDSTTFFIDQTDATKKLQFQISGIATATTRTITWPDSDVTIPATIADLTTNQTIGGAKTFSSKITASLGATSTFFNSDRFVLADDGVKVIALTNDKVAILTINSLSSPTSAAAIPCGQWWLRATASPAQVLGYKISGANVVMTSGVLTGTTGTDGNFTISTHTDGNIYLENRSGIALTLITHIIAN